MKKSLLLVASRWPWPVSTGHDRMLDQFVTMASGAGFNVHVRAFARKSGVPDIPAACGLVSAEEISMPGIGDFLKTAFRGLPGTLQECLYWSAGVRSELARTAASIGAAVVVTDMLRLAGYAMDPSIWPDGCRRVLFMEDLLSDRYGMMKGQEGRDGPMGHLRSAVPRPVAAAASMLPSLAFRVEARLAHVREVAAAAACDATILVADAETAILRQRSPGSAVHVFRPVVSAVPVVTRASGQGPKFIFIGPGNYAPNAFALKIASEAARLYQGATNKICTVHWAGDPGDLAPMSNVLSLGRVPDLADVLTADSVLLAPLPRGTGISTKVLEAMAAGVPVIATPGALRGITSPGSGAAIDCSTDPVSVQVAMAAVAADPVAADRCGAEGWRIVKDKFSRTSVLENLVDALGGRGDVAAGVSGQ
jgi:hypothetical protein